MIERLRNGTEDELPWAGLRIRISRNLPEQPINLLMPREILRELSGECSGTYLNRIFTVMLSEPVERDENSRQLQALENISGLRPRTDWTPVQISRW